MLLLFRIKENSRVAKITIIQLIVTIHNINNNQNNKFFFNHLKIKKLQLLRRNFIDLRHIGHFPKRLYESFPQRFWQSLGGGEPLLLEFAEQLVDVRNRRAGLAHGGVLHSYHLYPGGDVYPEVRGGHLRHLLLLGLHYVG